MALLRRLLADARGVSTAEYAALLALVGAALAFAAINLSREIACSMEHNSTAFAGKGGTRHPELAELKRKPLATTKQCDK